MKINSLLCTAVAVLILSAVVEAGTVGGVGGSTEFTQIANNIQLVNQYEQQVLAYTRQGLQMEAELKNLIQNPTSLLGSDLGRLINGVGQIMSNGKAIGGNLAAIDQRFGSTFKSPQALTLSKAFTQWHSTSTDTLQNALKAAGMHRDQFASDTDALTALYNHSQNTNGALDAAQTLAQMNAMEIQHLQKLSDLMATQNIASSTYMASETAKAQKQIDSDSQIQKSLSDLRATPIPDLETSSKVYNKWGLYKPQ